MHDIGDLLSRAGFADPVMDQERLRLTWSSADRLLADLRALGGNVAPNRFRDCARHDGVRARQAIGDAAWSRWFDRLRPGAGGLATPSRRATGRERGRIAGIRNAMVRG